jgi:hypothetical protein
MADQVEAERQALDSKAKFTVKHSIANCLVIYCSPCHQRYKNSFFYVLTNDCERVTVELVGGETQNQSHAA